MRGPFELISANTARGAASDFERHKRCCSWGKGIGRGGGGGMSHGL